MNSLLALYARPKALQIISSSGSCSANFSKLRIAFSGWLILLYDVPRLNKISRLKGETSSNIDN